MAEESFLNDKLYFCYGSISVVVIACLLSLLYYCCISATVLSCISSFLYTILLRRYHPETESVHVCVCVCVQFVHEATCAVHGERAAGRGQVDDAQPATGHG